MNFLSRAVQRRWYGNSPGWLWLLWPLSRLYARVASARRERARPWRAPVPVIVVGNITVGGTGKTPVVAALTEYLRGRGYRPGIVSRGYGGGHRHPTAVNTDSDPAQVGDEPVLLAQLCGCPVWVARDRSAAVRALLAASDCDVIIADDGLQHHALGRDLELVVIDGQRGLGNSQLLPVGPLRETAERLASVDWVLVNGGDWQWPGALRFELRPTAWVRLSDGARLPLDRGPFDAGHTDQSPLDKGPLDQRPRARVHALAGIGHPQRFFDTLRELGLEPVEHAYADHHSYRAADLAFSERLPIVTTAKDAVKLRTLPASRLPQRSEEAPQLWYLAVQAALPDALLESLAERLHRLAQRASDR